MKEEETDVVEEQTTKRTTESRKLKRRSLSPDVPSRRKESSKDREDSEKSVSKRKKQKNGSHCEERSRAKKKKKKSKSKKRKKKKTSTRSDDSEGNSEPEEGEITESDKEEWESTSGSSSHMESPESEMETQCPEGEKKRDEFQVWFRVDVTRKAPHFSLTLLLSEVTMFLVMKCVCFSSRQRHLAALRQSHSGQISSAAGWHTLHHHR